MTEIVKADKVEAHRRAELIRVGMVSYAQTLETIAESFAARDWVTLGYGSWDEYVDKEFAEKRLKLDGDRRREAAEALRLTGMSTRAIGSALGVSHQTVANDLASGGQNLTPAPVAGADGKTYPATRMSKGVASTDTPADDPAAARYPCGCERGNTTCDLYPNPYHAPTAHAAAAAKAARAAAASVVDEAPTAPSAPSPLEQYLAADPTLARTGWQKQFAGALAKSIGIVSFTPDQIAEYADRQLVDELLRLVTNLDNYATRAEKAWAARNGSLRVLKGGAA
jgi:hypothetical protein